MLTVQDLAAHYGVTVKFTVQALGKMGVQGELGPGTRLTDMTINRFETAFGDRIRAARPVPPPEPLTVPEMREKRRQEEQARPHVVRVAYQRVTARKAGGLTETVMQTEALRGPAHAIDPVGTNDGEPWAADSPPGDDAHHFYSHPGPPAACGVRVRVVIGEAFTPDREDVCPQCLRAFANDEAFRNPPGEYYREPRFCEAYIRIKNPEGVIRLEDCCLPNYHDGRHSARSGATWERGAEDYRGPPSSDEGD